MYCVFEALLDVLKLELWFIIGVLYFPQIAVVLFHQRVRWNSFFCVRKLSMCSIYFWWHCHHKCCLSGCATEMLMAPAYRGHLSGLDTHSTGHSCVQCDLKFWKLIDNELARCWIGRAGTVSGLWSHMTLPTRKISVEVYHGVGVRSLASKKRWRKCKILFPTLSASEYQCIK